MSGRLSKAVKLSKLGQGDQAVVILRELVQDNDKDMYAWLWLAEVTVDVDEARYAAHRVLELRPTNRRAQIILEGLGEPSGNDWLPQWLHPKKKHIERSKQPFNWRLVAFIGVSVALLIGAFVLLTDFSGADSLDNGLLIVADNESGDDNGIVQENMSPADLIAAGQNVKPDNEQDGMAKIAVFKDLSVDENNNDSDQAVDSSLPDDPEAMTLAWLRDVATGQREAEISLSCDPNEPSGIQATIEPLATRLLEYGVTTALRTIQLDALFNLLEVVDNTAEYRIDGHIEVTVFGQTLRSPEFSTVVRFVSDQGQWAICEVSGQ